MNRFSKRRDRALLLTDQHLYKLEPSRQYRVMRAVPLDAVSLCAPVLLPTWDVRNFLEQPQLRMAAPHTALCPFLLYSLTFQVGPPHTCSPLGGLPIHTTCTQVPFLALWHTCLEPQILFPKGKKHPGAGVWAQVLWLSKGGGASGPYPRPLRLLV